MPCISVGFPRRGMRHDEAFSRIGTKAKDLVACRHKQDTKEQIGEKKLKPAKT